MQMVLTLVLSLRGEERNESAVLKGARGSRNVEALSFCPSWNRGKEGWRAVM